MSAIGVCAVVLWRVQARETPGMGKFPTSALMLFDCDSRNACSPVTFLRLISMNVCLALTDTGDVFNGPP